MKKAESVEEYIRQYPAEVQQILLSLRVLVREVVPAAIESISYAMPGYKLNGKPLVYFAAYEKHIGVYATPTGHAAFEAELSEYKRGKGSVQFPLNQPMPYELIRRLVAFRAEELASS